MNKYVPHSNNITPVSLEMSLSKLIRKHIGCLADYLNTLD